MHDGSFATLDIVLEHYRHSKAPSATLAPELQQQAQLGIHISASDKQKIIAFLHTLTDEEFIYNKTFFKP